MQVPGSPKLATARAPRATDFSLRQSSWGTQQSSASRQPSFTVTAEQAQPSGASPTLEADASLRAQDPWASTKSSRCVLVVSWSVTAVMAGCVPAMSWLGPCIGTQPHLKSVVGVEQIAQIGYTQLCCCSFSDGQAWLAPPPESIQKQFTGTCPEADDT